eukprot:scaffold1518_cov417-Prasinococcus_capsulatus_cf.AAC.11
MCPDVYAESALLRRFHRHSVRAKLASGHRVSGRNTRRLGCPPPRPLHRGGEVSAYSWQRANRPPRLPLIGRPRGAPGRVLSGAPAPTTLSRGRWSACSPPSARQLAGRAPRSWDLPDSPGPTIRPFVTRCATTQ